MSGGSTKARNKKSDNRQGKEKTNINKEKDRLTAEASTAMAKPQANLDSISKQIEAMRSELKTDLTIFKEDIATQIKNELTEFKENINQKLVKIHTEVGQQNDKIDAVVNCTEDFELWSTEEKNDMHEIIKEHKFMTEKLDDLESRSRRNNLRIYGIPEDAELKSDTVAMFVDKWLRDELSLETDLQIQRAHRALAPKPKLGQPPRSIILNFLQFHVKEMVLKRAWEKKTVKLGDNRIYFDHDYTARILLQRKAYAGVKKILKGEGIRFQTPLNKMRIHWANGMKTYNSAEEAASDMRGRGYEVEDTTATRGSAGRGGLKSTGIETWTRIGNNRTTQTGKRARGLLREFEH
ncbi:LINE-1 type transposase domain containing protein 1 [Dissostichus eleginoides]|uniref:LINE-1 type transposase domain containing protein 1 n=1 Tax=Dissostichus eleginoides TaxID=100907 RepID=A0AAD9EMV0_DISEL|nr:LINE-1 type transposase domain containing protein 1 [Dissostichus eleginoides]